MGMDTNPDLPLLHLLRPYADVLLIGCQHILPSTVSLLRQFDRAGIPFENMHFIGKCYSTVPGALQSLKILGVDVHGGSIPKKAGCYYQAHRQDVKSLWQKVETILATGRYKRIVVMDDGGEIISSIPSLCIPVVAVEQTTKGLTRLNTTPLPCPVISVAGSVAKREHESPFIAAAIVESISRRTRPNNVGIIGAGAIGYACAQKLVARFNGTVRVYTKVTPEIDKHNVILGCTGYDQGRKLKKLRAGKIFASASSGDIEFNTILRQSNSTGFDDLTVCGQTILNGGYPVNFVRNCELESAEDIQLTRGFLYMAVLQSFMLFGQPPAIYDLPMQADTVRQWRRAAYSL